MDNIPDVVNEKSALKNNAGLLIVFLILLPLLINTIRNPNNDYGLVSGIVRDWVGGRIQLYEAGSVYYNYTPWLLLFYIPLSFIPPPFGQLIFNLVSLCLLIWSTWYLTRPVSWKVMAIALATIYTCMLIIQGQFDALVLASLTLGWIGFKRKNPWMVGIALVGMTAKYTNVIIPILVLLFAIRRWPIKKLLNVAIFPLVIIGISFVIAGWDWPIRYIRLLSVTMAFFQKYSITTLFSTTTYPISYRFLWPPLGLILEILFALVSVYVLLRLLRMGVEWDTMNLALALNLVISPYFTFHHIIYLAPLQAQLLKKQPFLGFVLFGTAIVDILLLWLGIGVIIYPVVALLLTIISSIKKLYQPEAPVAVAPISLMQV